MSDRIPPETLVRIASYMDGFSLAAWRDTCRRHYSIGGYVLRQDMRQCIARYSTPNVIEALLTRFHGYIIGLVALSLVLREPSIVRNVVSVSIPYQHFSDVIQEVLEPQKIISVEIFRWRSSLCITASVRYQLSPMVTLSLSFTHDANPLAIFRVTPSSLFMSYANMDVIGCLYPLLTSRRLALVRKPSSGSEAKRMIAALQSSHPIGFSFAFHPSAWVPSSPAGGTPPRCYEDRFICPAQERCMDDRGTFHTVITENSDGRAQGSSRSALTWRLDSGGFRSSCVVLSLGSRSKSMPPRGRRLPLPFCPRQHPDVP